MNEVMRRTNRAHRLRGLYVIADPSLRPRGDIIEAVLGALRGGASIVQWRDKVRTKDDQLSEAKFLAKACRERDALFIVNDDPDLAIACEADGLHVGQKDISIPDARRILWPSQLVGRSNALLEEAVESQAQGADYIAVGAMYPSTTKVDTRLAGLRTLQRVKSRVSAPVVAIGGITEQNVREVIRAGADVICVAQGVIGSPNPERAATNFLTAIREGYLTCPLRKE